MAKDKFYKDFLPKKVKQKTDLPEDSEPKRFTKSKPKSSKFSKNEKRPFSKQFNPAAPKSPAVEPPPTDTRLNKYLSTSGVASRRKADEIIANGEVSVNGIVVKEPGYHVKPNDEVKYKDRVLRPIRYHVYYLMNKPSGVITTVSDDKGRKTVFDIIRDKIKVRVYPVGRLDRNTTGLLLLTNDGDLTKKLSHPSHQVKKMYHVRLDKPLTEQDLISIKQGITLEDGLIKVDGISYIKDATEHEVGVTIHSGKNRIIRRIFEHLGYEVMKLDRFYYAGLTKKNLPRGRYRPLTQQEVIMLQHFT